jgi:hypothetical protein
VIEVDVGEDNPPETCGVAADETHQFRQRDFGIKLSGKIF